MRGPDRDGIIVGKVDFKVRELKSANLDHCRGYEFRNLWTANLNRCTVWEGNRSTGDRSQLVGDVVVDEFVDGFSCFLIMLCFAEECDTSGILLTDGEEERFAGVFMGQGTESMTYGSSFVRVGGLNKFVVNAAEIVNSNDRLLL